MRILKESNLGDFSIYGTVLVGYNGHSGDVVIPDGITHIGNSAFYSMGIDSVTISDSVEEIGEQSFQNCHMLKNLVIPDSVKRISTFAFSNCKNLTDVSIGRGVTGIENGTILAGCSTLSHITVDSSNPLYYSTGNCIIQSQRKSLVVGCGNSVIPDDGSILEIGEFAFMNSSIDSIKIPNGVTTIMMGAFSQCTKLNRIEIPNSVTMIGNSAFHNCPSLTQIAIPNGVRTIRAGAFSWCNNIEIYIPESVVEIGSNIFERGSVNKIYTDNKCVIEKLLEEGIPEEKIKSIYDIYDTDED